MQNFTVARLEDTDVILVAILVVRAAHIELHEELDAMTEDDPEFRHRMKTMCVFDAAVFQHFKARADEAGGFENLVPADSKPLSPFYLTAVPACDDSEIVYNVLAYARETYTNHLDDGENHLSFARGDGIPPYEIDLRVLLARSNAEISRRLPYLATEDTDEVLSEDQKRRATLHAMALTERVRRQGPDAISERDWIFLNAVMASDYGPRYAREIAKDLGISLPTRH
jgi:hypothetical protein